MLWRCRAHQRILLELSMHLIWPGIISTTCLMLQCSCILCLKQQYGLMAENGSGVHVESFLCKGAA